MDPCAFFRKLQFYIIWLFLSPSRLISPYFLFSLIFKFPCTMGEDIRIFYIEIIHLIGCNITTVIVIIFTESIFELFDQLIPKIRTYLDSGVQQFCVLFWIRTKFFFPESSGVFFELFFKGDVLRIKNIKIPVRQMRSYKSSFFQLYICIAFPSHLFVQLWIQ